MGPKNHVLDGGPQVLKDIAMATDFGTNIAITGFVWTIATRQFVMEGGLSGWPTKCRYCRFCATKGHCHGNHFCLSVCGVYIGATWRIRLNRLCAVAMRPYVKLLWPLVLLYWNMVICLNGVVFTPFSGSLGEWLEGIFGVYSNGWTALESYIRSTPPSWPNNISGGNVRPSVGTSVCPYVHPQSLSNFNEIWYVHRGPWVMHDGMPYDPIHGQGQGHGAKVPKIALFKVYLLRHLQRELANDH